MALKSMGMVHSALILMNVLLEKQFVVLSKHAKINQAVMHAYAQLALYQPAEIIVKTSTNVNSTKIEGHVHQMLNVSIGSSTSSFF